MYKVQKNLNPRDLKPKIKIVVWGMICVLTVVVDEIIKFLALRKLPEIGSFVDFAFVRLAVHKNFGIAFDIPFKLWLIILISLIIGLFLGQIFINNLKNQPKVALMALIIIIGALGNLFDRIIYGFTVDYIIFFNRLAINLSDLVILYGVAGLLILTQKKTSSWRPHNN